MGQQPQLTPVDARKADHSTADSPVPSVYPLNQISIIVSKKLQETGS